MSTNIIKINRGDSFEFKIRITDATNCDKSYQLVAGDAVYFALLYPNQRFEDAIFIRHYDHTDSEYSAECGELLIKIKPNDTRCLTPGVYYYTVKLQRGGSTEVIDDFDNPEEVRTLVERTKFIINE